MRKYKITALFCVLVIGTLMMAQVAAAESAVIVKPYWNRAILRAGRTETLNVRLENPTENPLNVSVRIVLPPELKLLDPAVKQTSKWTKKAVYASCPFPNPVIKEYELRGNSTLSWRVTAGKPFDGVVKVIATANGIATNATVEASFKPAVISQPAPYVPEPRPVVNPYHIGMIYWASYNVATFDYYGGWSMIEPYPERQPALGWFDDSNPECTDWQIKWALEHGIEFFCYIWGRDYTCVPGPIKPSENWAIDQTFPKAKYNSKIKFCIAPTYTHWMSGLTQFDGAIQYWIDNYFKKSNYLKIDGKPVIFFYSPWELIDDLGGPSACKAYLDGWRQKCVEQGLGGLWIAVEMRSYSQYFQYVKDSGFDANWAYCASPQQTVVDEAAVQCIIDNTTTRINANVLPVIPTLSSEWDPSPWIDYTQYPFGTADSPKLRMSPRYFKQEAEQMKALVDSGPSSSPFHNFVLLDNWAEFGEGHYLAPCREYGFGFIDAIRDVFTQSPAATHIDILPEDVGLGPYDQTYLNWVSTKASLLGQ
ncbi:MAG: glycoside hydrolase family 99-like domain-containing protein [Armatimonadota bacterium]|nr:glycoside hydrolase family 99-like domain-containing protein [bacterium]